MTEEVGARRSPHHPRRALKGFLGIATGSTVAQLLVFAALPVLSRVYTPADTARYALLLGIGAVLASFASLRLDLAVPIPDDVEDSRDLFWLAVLVPLVVLPIVGVVASALHATGVWNANGLDWVDFLAVSLFVLVVCLYTAASQLAIRLQSYGILSRIPVIQMIGTLTAQVALGAGGSSRGLFFGGLIGRSLGLAGLLRACSVHIEQIPSRPHAIRLVKKYWRFPLLFAPASLIGVLGYSLAPLMLPALFGFGPAGLYAMATRIASIPVGILSQSGGQVFLGEFARASNRASSLRVFFRWSVALLCMATAVTSAIWILAPLVLPSLLGDGWNGTAQLVQYAGVMAGATIVGSPLHHVWTVRQRGLMELSWNLVRLIVVAAVIWMGAKGGDSLAQVAWALAIATTAIYGLGWLGCLWAAARPEAGSLRTADEPPLDPEQTSSW